jgi:pimeloyl-ACP methyl ester carboxylesterase
MSCVPPPAWTPRARPSNGLPPCVGPASAPSWAPAAVFGTSSGAVFALSLTIGHPETVTATILHEPALLALADDAGAVAAAMKLAVSAGMEAGGAPAAVESFWRFVATDESWERLDPTLRERMCGSGELYFGLERGRFDAAIPSDEALGAIAVPVHVLASDASRDFFISGVRAAGRAPRRRGRAHARHAHPIPRPSGRAGGRHPIPAPRGRRTTPVGW